MAIPKVLIEVEGGEVTGVQSTHALEVGVINRDMVDASDSHYRADVAGAPAQMRFLAAEASLDVAELYDQLIAGSACEECDVEEE